jgi:uncharacterized protein
MPQAKGREARPLRTVLWRRIDTLWLERCTLIQGRGRPSELWTLEGTVIGASEEAPFEVRYSVHCDEGWTTARVVVTARIGTDTREVGLVVDDGGRWLLGTDEAELPDVMQSVDVDLGFTPATNTLPIRRLGLEIGDSRDVLATWVRFPELTVEPFPQRYTRLAERRYLYESLTSDFKAELTVDDLGLVIEYAGLWERSAESSAPATAPYPTR